MKKENVDSLFSVTHEAHESFDPQQQKWMGYMYYIAMNESLRNYSEDFAGYILRQLGISLKFNIDHFYFCLTGLKKKIYTPVYGLHTKEYLKISMKIMSKLQSQLSCYNYAADVFVENYDDNKQIAILFSPMREDCITPKEMALHISKTVQIEYEKSIFEGKNQYCNFTALSSRLSGFSGMREGFLQTRELSDLSFFRMEPIVARAEDIEEWRKKADYHSVIAVCAELKRALIEGDEKKSVDYFKTIFLSLLKDSFDISLCIDALSYIKSMLATFYTVYEITGCINLKKLCNIDSYNKIEECYNTFAVVAKHLCEQVNAQGRYSGIVQQAIYYIKSNYQNDISLLNISKYVGITPRYLSELFKREAGMTISEYIVLCRIEKAKALLMDSNQRVYQIAKAVGFHDIKYFGRMFKKLVSLSPLEYRGSIRNI